MTSVAPLTLSPLRNERIAVVGAIGLGAMIAIAVARRIAVAGPSGLALHHVWLAIHLATVIPAVPLGAYLLVRRKGDRLHRMLGRIWAGLMLTTALVSFGVQSSGHLSWIHLFSVLVLVSVPRAVLAAMRGDIARHRRGIMGVYIGLVVAGAFTFLPGRMLGQWLIG